MKTSRKIKKIIKKMIFFPYSTGIKLHQEYRKRKITKILSCSSKPIYYDSDELFETLQNKYPPLPEYGYDFYSSWNRGMERASSILKKFELLRNSSMDILEVGCGDGMVGYILRTFGHSVALTDLNDWRQNKAKDITFVKSDLNTKLSLNSESFDFVFSYNTFEHVNNPQVAFNELMRVCKKEGHIYLDFGPLYASPWGLHAFETLRIPYPQYLFSEDFIKYKLKKLGIFDLGRKLTDLQPLNKLRIKDFMNMCSNAQCEVISFSKYIIENSHLNIIMKYPKAFTGRGLGFDDVTVEEIAISIRKK